MPFPAAAETLELAGRVVRSGLSEEASVRSVCAVLERGYGNPTHGNKSNPLDELVYIILSTRTRDEIYRATFRTLKAAFPTWNSVQDRDLKRIEQLLQPAGLGRLKAQQLVRIFEILRATFGRATLSPLSRMTDAEAEAFLTALPGVGLKVAKCVLMYSLGRKVLPVDAHVHRIASRLGMRTKKRADTSQDLIERAVPADLRYGFHVNAVAHGRSVCLPLKPSCERCEIASWCSYFREHRDVRVH